MYLTQILPTYICIYTCMILLTGKWKMTALVLVVIVNLLLTRNLMTWWLYCKQCSFGYALASGKNYSIQAILWYYMWKLVKCLSESLHCNLPNFASFLFPLILLLHVCHCMVAGHCVMCTNLLTLHSWILATKTFRYKAIYFSHCCMYGCY